MYSTVVELETEERMKSVYEFIIMEVCLKERERKGGNKSKLEIPIISTHILRDVRTKTKYFRTKKNRKKIEFETKWCDILTFL